MSNPLGKNLKKNKTKSQLSVHFDSAFYLTANPDVAATGHDPIEHYLDHGWREGRNPRSDFDTRSYLGRYKDVARSGINPFLHFVLYGQKEGRSAAFASEFHASDKPRAAGIARPAVNGASDPRGERDLTCANVDAAFYRATYPDVAADGTDPGTHYWEFGWQEGRNPTAQFDTNFYLAEYPDIAASGLNPFFHYLLHGRGEGRLPNAQRRSPEPVRTIIAEPVATPARDAATSDLDLVASQFDAAHYLRAYKDVAAAGMDPVRHYLDHGWNEGRNPTLDFNSAYYLKSNPDVAQAGINPFLHYLRYGREEGRKPSSLILDLMALKDVQRPWTPSGRLAHAYDLSVVIPTYNRAWMLPDLLISWRALLKHTKYSFEIIFSDDGSDDDSLAILEAATDLPIKIVRNDHGGAAKARNSGILAAQGEKILFMGDDIFPDETLINRHVEKHRELPDTAAILGLCDWHPKLDVNHLMKHITELGCEQFSFIHLPSHGYTDFRHFYTCNVSIDREFLLTEQRLFDEKFYKVNFEDAELGYRLAKKGMKIFYYPEAYGDHYHPYNDVKKFCIRQETAGEMAIVFNDLHPEVVDILPLEEIAENWRAFMDSSEVSYDFYSALAKACQEVEDKSPDLGKDLLARLSSVYSVLFRFAFEKGYCQSKFAVSAGLANRVLVSRFFSADMLASLRALQSAGLCDIAELERARTAALETGLPPRTEPKAESPVADRASRQEKPVPASAPVSKLARAYAATLLTVEADTLGHLNALMELYGTQGGRIRYVLRSEMAVQGMVYSPDEGEEINLSNMKQLLLFLEQNPQVDCVLLSFGLVDLPYIGVRNGGGFCSIKRKGTVTNGKVVRLFEALDTQPVHFDSLLDARFRLVDQSGRFMA